MNNDIYHVISSGLLVFAIGDAMGVPIEFTSRESHALNPLKEMVGYGSHLVPPGTWSDDTSMTIATMDSIQEKHTIGLVRASISQYPKEEMFAMVRATVMDQEKFRWLPPSLITDFHQGRHRMFA